jgi:3D (Asp-Asp-Asp) domain-containing protein
LDLFLVLATAHKFDALSTQIQQIQEQLVKTSETEGQQLQRVVNTLNGINQALEELKQHGTSLDKAAEKLYKLQPQIKELLEFLDPGRAQEHTITGYAPLDPNAVYGMDYIGDPTATASGAKVVPGVTAAAGPDVPFGTKLYIQGIGWRIVQDRGGRITNRNIDLAMRTRQDALRFGKRKLPVIMVKP